MSGVKCSAEHPKRRDRRFIERLTTRPPSASSVSATPRRHEEARGRTCRSTCHRGLFGSSNAVRRSYASFGAFVTNVMPAAMRQSTPVTMKAMV